MPDLVTLSRTLVLLLAVPWLGAALLAVRPWTERRARRLSVAVAAVLGGVALAHAVALTMSPRKLWLQHLWDLVQVGRFDAGVELTLDPASAWGLVGIAGLAVVFLFRGPAEAFSRRRRARALALVGALAAALLAGNLLVFFFALHAAAFTARGVTRLFPFRAALYGAAAWTLGALLLSVFPWPTDAGEPASDGAPTLVAQRAPEGTSEGEASPGNAGTLTLTSPSGAVVYLDGMRAPLLGADGEPLHAPFVRARVPAGVHSIRVQRGPGSADDVLPRVVVEAERELVLTPLGSSLAFRDLRARAAYVAQQGEAVPVGARIACALAALAALLVAGGIANATWRSVAQAAAVAALAVRLGGTWGASWAAVAAAGVALGVAGVGWILARAGRTVMTTGLQGAVDRHVRAVAEAVAGLDHWVLGGIVDGALVLLGALAWTVRAIEARTFGAWLDAAARRLKKLTRRKARALGVMVLLTFVTASGASRSALPPSSAPLSSAPMAAAARARGKILVEVPGGGRGPVVLEPKSGGYVGELLVRNVGDEPLVVSRLAIRGDGEDVRSPRHVSARFAEGPPTTATIPPSGFATVIVAWMPERSPRAKQAFGHVVITSTDEASGEVAMGFRGSIPRPVGILSEHPLTWLLAIPFVAAAILLGLRLAGRDERSARPVALTAAVAELGLAAWIAYAFTSGLTRADGNDGLQLIDRAPWIRALGAEYFVGVDGVGVAMLLLIAILGVIGIGAWGQGPRGGRPSYEAVLAVVGGMAGVVAAQDVLLFVVFWGVVLVALALLVGGAERGGGTGAASKLLLFGSFGFACLVLAVCVLHAHADRTLLLDGTVVPHGFSIPEWAHVDFSAKGDVAGVPVAKLAWGLLFVGFGAAVGVFPLHTWLTDARASLRGASAVLVGGGYAALGAYGLVKLGVAVLPEAARWAGAMVVALGVLTIVWGALCGLLQRDLGRLAAYGSMSYLGFAVMGIGALTAQGLTGAIVALFAHGLLVSLGAIVLTALEERTHTTHLEELSGLVRDAPRLAGATSVALLGAAAAPGLVAFWGVFLVLVGTFAGHPVIAGFALVGATIHAGAHLAALRRLLFGAIRPGWRKNPRFEPFGGRLPDLAPREAAAAALLVSLVVLLGLWPAPLVSRVEGGVREPSRGVELEQIARTAEAKAPHRPGS